MKQLSTHYRNYAQCYKASKMIATVLGWEGPERCGHGLILDTILVYVYSNSGKPLKTQSPSHPVRIAGLLAKIQAIYLRMQAKCSAPESNFFGK
jgi:hypothetical protein